VNVENRPEYNGNKLRYPSNLTDDDSRRSNRLFHQPNVAGGNARLSCAKAQLTPNLRAGSDGIPNCRMDLVISVAHK